MTNITHTNMTANLNALQADWDAFFATLVLPAQTDKTYAMKANCKQELAKAFQVFQTMVQQICKTEFLATP